MEVGGGTSEADGPPIRVTGTLAKIVQSGFEGSPPWVVIEFGRHNILIVTPFLTQIVDPRILKDVAGVDLSVIRVLALKSRVHFRRGFVDSGLVNDVILVEPDRPLVGTIRLGDLKYEHINIRTFYPYGREHFDPRSAMWIGNIQRLNVKHGFTEER